MSSTQSPNGSTESIGSNQNQGPSITTRYEAMQDMPGGLYNIRALPYVGDELATRLREAGLSTIPDIHHNDAELLERIEGIGEVIATEIRRAVARRCNYHFGDYAWQPFKEHTPEIARE